MVLVQRNKLVHEIGKGRGAVEEESGDWEGEGVAEEREAGVGDEREPMSGYRFEVDE